MNDLINKTAKRLKQSKKTVVLTGAGISVESGIPPFRGEGGLWEKIDPMEYAHINAFMKNPEKVWKVLITEMKSIIDNAKPNDAHKGLAYLEKNGPVKAIITQNIDGLHQLSGSSDVIEFHGNFAYQKCTGCYFSCRTSEVDLSTIPPTCPECGKMLRPDCIFFGEMIPTDVLYRSEQLSTQCDLMLVIGVSAVVQPASSMPVIAKHNGAKVIEINPEPTPLTNSVSDDIIKGKAGEVMRQLVDCYKNLD